MKLYVVRHGQTEINVNNCMQGRIDSDLTEVGIEQTYKVIESLQGISIDLILSSPMKRCRKMAALISDGKIPILIDERLLGREHGEFTGLNKSSIDWNTYWNYYINEHYESAENIQDLYKRIGDLVTDLSLKYSDKTVLVFTHSSFIRVLHYYFNGIPEDGMLSEIEICNGQIFEYNL